MWDRMPSTSSIPATTRSVAQCLWDHSGYTWKCELVSEDEAIVTKSQQIALFTVSRSLRGILLLLVLGFCISTNAQGVMSPSPLADLNLNHPSGESRSHAETTLG
jgi:hypothetical protein